MVAVPLNAKQPLTVKEHKFLDQRAKTVLGISENILIENAAIASFEVIRKLKQSVSSVSVFSGRGNNGADSLALVRHLINNSIKVRVYLVYFNSKPNKQVDFQLNILKQIKLIHYLEIVYLNDLQDVLSLKKDVFLKNSDLVIDGIFGIGFKGSLSCEYKNLFQLINNNNSKVISLDIASGVFADTGDIDQIAIVADITVSFIAAKFAFLRGKGVIYSGKVYLKNIGVSREILEKL